MAKQRRDSTTVYLERTNPLAGMSIRALQSVFDAARAGDTQRLHWIFQEVEACNPVLCVCVERRAAAVTGFRWKVSERSSSDGGLAAEQKDAADRLLQGIENLVDVFEHLDLAFFRGFAHAQPVWEEDGTVRHIECLDSWKFLRRGEEWFFNPECDGFSGSVQSCADARLISVVRRRPVDYPALSIHVRHAVGNRDWGRFLERYALPKPAMTMHPGASKADRADYELAAQAVENGQVSVWPHGSSLADFAGGSRGVDPFQNFIEHQERTTVLLATGGTLASLAESGTGTLAGGAQADVWQSIVARDSLVIAQALNRSLVRPYLESAFPGQKICVDFGFDFDPTPTAREIFELAAAARSAGYRIDKAELEEKTGFTLLEEPQMPQMPSLGGVISNRAGGTPLQNDETILQNARQGLDDKTDGETPTPSQNAFFAAFTEGNNQLAQEVKKLLANPSPDAAKALLEKLPELLKEDPALAALIAEEMAKEFEGVGEVENSECRAKNPTTCRTHGNTREKKTRGLHDYLGCADPESLSANPSKNFKRGEAALSAIMKKQSGYIDKAMYRPECGWIRFQWGDPGNPNQDYNHGHGISHVLAKHPEDISLLPQVIAHGKAVVDPTDTTKVILVTDSAFAVLIPLGQSGERVLTMFEPRANSKTLAEIKKYPPAKKRGGR